MKESSTVAEGFSKGKQKKTDKKSSVIFESILKILKDPSEGSFNGEKDLR